MIIVLVLGANQSIAINRFENRTPQHKLKSIICLVEMSHPKQQKIIRTLFSGINK